MWGYSMSWSLGKPVIFRERGRRGRFINPPLPWFLPFSSSPNLAKDPALQRAWFTSITLLPQPEPVLPAEEHHHTLQERSSVFRSQAATTKTEIWIETRKANSWPWKDKYFRRCFKYVWGKWNILSCTQQVCFKLICPKRGKNWGSVLNKYAIIFFPVPQ